VTRPPSDLEAAYRRARYRVDDGAAAIELRIDAASRAAADLLKRHGVSGAALVTGCNPGSQLASTTDNDRAQRALEAAVAAERLPWLPGAGLDPDGLWPAEPSLLVLGIGRCRAAALARCFGQAAFVWVGVDGVAVLVWT